MTAKRFEQKVLLFELQTLCRAMTVASEGCCCGTRLIAPSLDVMLLASTSGKCRSLKRSHQIQSHSCLCDPCCKTHILVVNCKWILILTTFSYWALATYKKALLRHFPSAVYTRALKFCQCPSSRCSSVTPKVLESKVWSNWKQPVWLVSLSSLCPEWWYETGQLTVLSAKSSSLISTVVWQVQPGIGLSLRLEAETLRTRLTLKKSSGSSQSLCTSRFFSSSLQINTAHPHLCCIALWSQFWSFRWDLSIGQLKNRLEALELRLAHRNSLSSIAPWLVCLCFMME